MKNGFKELERFNLAKPPFLITWRTMCRGRNRRIFQSKRRRNQKQRKVSVKVGRPPPNLGNIENTKPVIRYGTLNQETSVGPGNVGERRRKNCKEIQTGLQLREKKQ